MENLLFVTTAPRAITLHLSKVDHQGNTDHWAISSQGGIALEEMDQETVSMVLLSEGQALNADENKLLKRLCEGRTVHWIWHQASKYWKSWLKTNEVLYLEHQEHSRTGTINDFFVLWSLEKTEKARAALFEKYFNLSRRHAVDGLKRKYLNNYNANQLTSLGRRLHKREALSHTEALLLENYAQIAEHLALFERVNQQDGDTYYRLQLAEYLYGAN